MNETGKNSLRNIIVLTAITVVAAFALAITYRFTEAKINDSARLEALKSVKAVLPKDAKGNPLYTNDPDKLAFQMKIAEDQKQVDPVLVFYPGLNDKGEVIGFAVKVTSKIGYGGDIQMMIGMTPKGEILDIQILSMNETPGLGTKTNEPSFKDQFKGKSLETGAKFVLKKDDSSNYDLDAVSGATISSRAFTYAVHRVVTFYEAHKSEILTKGSGTTVNPVNPALNR
jgi:electron transport complex protein RnfG